jgi:hypothetical protein
VKIVLNDIRDLQDLLRVIDPALYAELKGVQLAVNKPRADSSQFRVVTPQASDQDGRDWEGNEPTGLPTDIAQPEPLASVSQDAVDGVEEWRDADGVEWHQDWHSEPKKYNADGRFKAKRGRDKDAYASWVEEQKALDQDVSGLSQEPDEPVATETHALPVQEESEAAETPAADAPAAPAVDLQALVASCAEASLDAPDNMMDLLNQAKAFIVDHSKGELDALKAVVAPLEDGTGGKPLQMLDPGQRRLLSACMKAYPTA